MFETGKEECLFCLDTHTGAFRHPLRLRERESSPAGRIRWPQSISIRQSVLRIVAAAMRDLRIPVRGGSSVRGGPGIAPFAAGVPGVVALVPQTIAPRARGMPPPDNEIPGDAADAAARHAVAS